MWPRSVSDNIAWLTDESTNYVVTFSMGWSVYLWKCELSLRYHSPQFSRNPLCSPPLIGQTEWFRKCCSWATTYSWTFIKSQSVVSGGMDHSWLIFPFVIVGSNYNIIEKLLWCLNYTLDCRSQSWRPVTSTAQTNSSQSNFLLWEIKQLAAWRQLTTDDHFTS